MKVLVFESRRLSYDSSWCFAQMICRGLKQCGAEVETFLLEEDISAQEEDLRKLSLGHFDGIFDINSRLPHVLLDETYFLDYFDAPFFHLIVDHPMHLHPSLQIPLKQYRVICLDNYHREYIRRYYPHIQKVYVMPFGGICQEEFSEKQQILPMDKRPYEILFPGTYTPLWYYREQMESVSDTQWEICEKILKKYKKGEPGSLEDFFRQEVGEEPEFFSLMMHKARLMDRYVREWYREKVIKALLNQGLTLDVMGFRWEMFSYDTPGMLRIHQPCTYPDQLNALGQSCITLNIQPLFAHGPHDRILNAMANKSIPFTDTCEYLQQQFSPGKELLLFDKNNPEEAAGQLSELLRQPDSLNEMSQHSYETFNLGHTWYHRIEQLMADV